MAGSGQAVLNEQGHLLGQVQLDGGGQVGGLAEVDKVLEGEGQSDGFGQGDFDILLGLLDIGVGANGNGSVTDVAGTGELDTLLAGLDDNWSLR